MLETIANALGGGVLGSGVLGGITGLIGGVLTQREERKRLESKQSHELEMARLSNEAQQQTFANQIELQKAEAEAQVQTIQIQGGIDLQQAQTEAEVTKSISEDDLHGKSYDHDTVRYVDAKSAPAFVRFLLGLVDFVRGLIRPTTTTWLLLLTTWAYFDMRDVLNAGPPISSDQAFSLLESSVGQISYLTLMVVAWWFGSRPKNLKAPAGA